MQKRYLDSELMKILKIDSATLQQFKKVREAAIKEAKKLNLKKNKKIKVLGISGSARDENDLAREKSNSETLLEICLERCKKLGAQTKLIPLRKYNVQPCKACYSTTNTQCHYPCSCYPKGTPAGDDMSNILYEEVLSADVIIFATPVNNFRISALLADFIDRCISLDGSLLPANPKDPKNKELNIKQMKFIELTADDNIPGSGLLRRFLGKIAGIITTGHEEGASMTISNLFLTLNYYGMIFPPFSSTYAMSSVCLSTYEDKKIVLSECHKEEVKLLAENVITAAKQAQKMKPFEWKYSKGHN